VRAVAALLATDLRQLVRSRRALLVGVLLPIAVWPAVLFISQRVSAEQQARLDQTVYLWSVAGEEADLLRRLVAEAEAAGPGEPDAGVTGDGPAAAGWPASFGLEEVVPAPDDFRTAIDEETIHVFVEALPPGTETAAAQEATGSASRTAASDPDHDAADVGTDDGAAPSPVPVFRAHYRADRDLSREAMDRLQRALARANEMRRERLLLARGFPARPSEMGVIETRDIASEAESTGLQLGRFISALLVSLLLAGGSVVASDSLAGEKERGTLETLLTTAVSRVQIVVAKQLSILVVALAMTAIQLAAIWAYIGSGIVDLPEGVSIALTPGLVVLLFVLYLPVAALLASALLLASAYAKSYKEAQLYFLPAFLIGIAPTLAPLLPGASLRSILALVPIANLSLAVKDILAGDPDPLLTVVAWLVTATAAAALAAASSRMLTRESLITTVQLEPSGALPGPELFRRDVVRWVAAAWAVILVASLFMGTGERILERQIGFNMSVMFGVTLLLLRRYRLPARETLSLRRPPPSAWLAVALGAPSALVVGLFLVQVTAGLMPVPEDVIRAFVEQMFPADLAPWKLLLLLVLLPAVFEELLFRGVLLSGLAGQRTAVRVLVCAVAFALFHVSFFRLVPTAFLGAMLALATLWTGSIFPAMAWHAANNAIAAFVLGDVEALPPWTAAFALPGLAVALYLLRRSGGVEARARPRHDG